jgi:hypothetical protein
VGEALAAAALDKERLAGLGGREAVQDRIEEDDRLAGRVWRALYRGEKQATVDVIEVMFARLAQKDPAKAQRLLRRLHRLLEEPSGSA